jgi:hypothetical protein
MIRHDLKIMFVHINKTGGSSIVRALNMLQVHLSVELIFSENINKDDQYKIWQGWEHGKRRTTYNWESLENIQNFWDDYFVTKLYIIKITKKGGSNLVMIG